MLSDNYNLIHKKKWVQQKGKTLLWKILWFQAHFYKRHLKASKNEMKKEKHICCLNLKRLDLTVILTKQWPTTWWNRNLDGFTNALILKRFRAYLMNCQKIEEISRQNAGIFSMIFIWSLDSFSSFLIIILVTKNLGTQE